VVANDRAIRRRSPLKERAKGLQPAWAGYASHYAAKLLEQRYSILSSGRVCTKVVLVRAMKESATDRLWETQSWESLQDGAPPAQVQRLIKY